ncbi:MAG: hypothetical protein ACMUJM_05560 [bacterium]
MDNGLKPLVLCIDDNHYIYKLEELYLQKAGYNVMGAEGGAAHSPLYTMLTRTSYCLM